MGSFSERYGYKKPRVQESYEGITPEVRVRIWNLFFKIYGGNDGLSYRLLSSVWDKFLKEDLFQFAPGYGVGQLCKWIGEKLNQSSWYEIYDFLEFVWEEDSGHRTIWGYGISQILVDERVPCTFINGLIIPITSPEEIAEITKAIESGDEYKPAREHLEKALAIMTDRKKSDFANSIKESISSLESLAKILLKDKKGILGDLTKKLDIHPCFREGLNKLYGWTSDAGGIRHGKTGKDPEPSLSEARFMLVLASAFFNYLVSTYSPVGEENI